jgi:cbb3-type cytochrome oxidase subunit 3
MCSFEMLEREHETAIQMLRYFFVLSLKFFFLLILLFAKKNKNKVYFRKKE